MLREANEIRLLIDSKFQEEHLPSEVFKHHNVYVSPINEIHTLSSNESVDKCLELIKKHPEWKFNCQMHKVYGWR